MALNNQNYHFQIHIQSNTRTKTSARNEGLGPINDIFRGTNYLLAVMVLPRNYWGRKGNFCSERVSAVINKNVRYGRSKAYGSAR